MPDLVWASAHELAGLLESGEVGSVDIVEALIQRTDDVDEKLHAYLNRTNERALDDARASDERRKSGELRSRFDGVPIAYKDLFVTKDVVTTSGSRILDGFVPPYDATVVARCSAAGMPMLGKLNMDEFAMGSSTENSGYGPTRNPWNLDCVPGGSSGGSTAIVAAGGSPWSWGTDTGGSIRQPASLCGLVGLKPTYGLISRNGMIAFASSLDQAGPITRSVKDAAVLLQTAAGGDDYDSTCLKEPVPDYLDGIEGGIEGMRVGLVKEFEDSEGTQPGVKQRVTEAYERLESLGAKIEEISLPSFDFGISAYYLVAPAECSSNLARYDGVRYGYRADGAKDIVEMTSKTRDEGFGDEVKRRIMLGTYALSAGYYDAYYGKAQKIRTLIIRDLERAYSQVDLIVCPTSPTTAFKLGERTADPLAMYLSDIFTVPFNLAGNTGISIPCGLSPDDGLPVGLQLSAKSLDERTLLRAAYAFEKDFGFSERPAL
jgi:aspartyl-tRNA(Asn)/glutamyl-tRNA(Gln) amidotransferase subunit A